MKINKSETLAAIQTTLSAFIDSLDTIESIDIDTLTSQESLVVMVDMIKGFCTIGPLSSPYVAAMVPTISEFIDKIIAKQIPIISYRDAHPQGAEEFNYFPSHCTINSEESQLMDMLERDELIDIPKNSTNGFLAGNPLELIDSSSLTNIYVIGCVTDICIRDFSTTINKYCQEKNLPIKINIIENLTDTYDIPDIHHRESEHVLALYQMTQAGIKLLRYNQ